LQSRHGLYTAWVYYHRVNQDTLPKLLGPKYLGGEIERTKQAIAELRPQDGSKRVLSRQDDKRLGELDERLADVEEFASRIQQIIRFQSDRGQTVGWSPNLNDGVTLNASPLFGLIPWPRKTKRGGKSVSELLALWQDLEGEKYEWAHMAMRYWPERVRAKCRQERTARVVDLLDRDLWKREVGESVKVDQVKRTLRLQITEGVRSDRSNFASTVAIPSRPDRRFPWPRPTRLDRRARWAWPAGSIAEPDSSQRPERVPPGSATTPMNVRPSGPCSLRRANVEVTASVETARVRPP